MKVARPGRPYCHRPAQHCDTDHVDDWYARTGATAEDNLAALCTRDHHTKDLPGWSCELDKNTRTFAITTPTNGRYTSDPEPLHPPRHDPLADEHPNDDPFDDDPFGDPFDGDPAAGNPFDDDPRQAEPFDEQPRGEDPRGGDPP